MREPPPKPEGSGFVRPGAEEHSAVEDLDGDGSTKARARVETLLAFLGAGNPTLVLRPADVETRPRALCVRRRPAARRSSRCEAWSTRPPAAQVRRAPPFKVPCVSPLSVRRELASLKPRFSR